MTVKLQWGNPPKPNLWKVTPYQSAVFTSKSDSKVFIVTSPLFRRTQDGDRWALKVLINLNKKFIKVILSYQDGRQFREYGTFKTPDNYHQGEEYLVLAAPSTWESAIKPALASAEKDWGSSVLNNKVASSEIKLQWGNPPKPNLWKVENRNPRFLITSPIFRSPYTEWGPTALEVKIEAERLSVRSSKFVPKATFHLGYVSALDGEFKSKVKVGSWYIEEFDLQVVGKIVQLSPITVLKSPIFWERAAKPAIEVVNKIWRLGPLLNRKVATSSRFPDTLKKADKVKLNWGTPAKPNVWNAWRHVNSRHISGSHISYYIESPLLKDIALEVKVELSGKVVAFSVTDFYAGSRKKLNHVTLADRKRGVAFTLEELDKKVRSNDFWVGWMSPTLKQNGHLDSVKIASGHRDFD